MKYLNTIIGTIDEDMSNWAHPFSKLFEDGYSEDSLDELCVSLEFTPPLDETLVHHSVYPHAAFSKAIPKREEEECYEVWTLQCGNGKFRHYGTKKEALCGAILHNISVSNLA